MNRRSFSKILGIGACIAVVNPSALFARYNPYYVIETFYHNGTKYNTEYFKVLESDMKEFNDAMKAFNVSLKDKGYATFKSVNDISKIKSDTLDFRKEIENVNI